MLNVVYFLKYFCAECSGRQYCKCFVCYRTIACYVLCSLSNMCSEYIAIFQVAKMQS